MKPEVVNIIRDFLEDIPLPEIEPRYVHMIDDEIDIVIDEPIEITPFYKYILDAISEITYDLKETGSKPLDISCSQVYNEWRWRQK